MNDQKDSSDVELTANHKDSTYAINNGHKNSYEQHFNGNGNGNGNGNESGNAFVRKYEAKAKRSSFHKSCSTKIFFFCTGFMVGLLLSLALLSAFQYLQDSARDVQIMNRKDTKYSSMSKGRSMKNFDHIPPQENDNNTTVQQTSSPSSYPPPPPLPTTTSAPTLSSDDSSSTASEEAEEEEQVKTTRRSVSLSEPEVTFAGTAIPDNNIRNGETTTQSVQRDDVRVGNSDSETTPPPITWTEERQEVSSPGAEGEQSEEGNGERTESTSAVSVEEEEKSSPETVWPIDDQLVTTTEAVVNSSDSEVEVIGGDAVVMSRGEDSESLTTASPTTASSDPTLMTTTARTRDEERTEWSLNETSTEDSPTVKGSSDSEVKSEVSVSSVSVSGEEAEVTTSEAVLGNTSSHWTTVESALLESERSNSSNSSDDLVISSGGHVSANESNSSEEKNETIGVIVEEKEGIAKEGMLKNDSSGHQNGLIVAEEEEEDQVFCLSSQFSCPNETNHCLDKDLLCDGFTDCPNDASDEQNCLATQCLQNFRCGEKRNRTSEEEEGVKCISRQNYCDGIWDCEDGSDELGCHLQECRKGEFLCKDGSACIKGKQACDGVSHCPDHSDEKGCASKDQCEQSNRYFCADGLCIENALRCDGIADCVNGSDEKDCETAEKCSSREGFFCENQNCVHKSKRCDGNNDCGDWSDEFACVKRDRKAVIHFYSPTTDTWSPLCAKHDFRLRDADALCHEFGQSRALNFSLIPAHTSLWAVIVSSSEEEGIPRSVHKSECATNRTVSVLCETFKCGSNASLVNSSLVSSGEDVPQSLLVTDGRSGGEECRAQMVASQWLLLSAKCLSKLSKNISEIQIKSKDTLLSVDRLIPHFRYSNFRSLRFADYDLALIRSRALSETLNNNNLVVCLPSHPIDPAITCFVAKGSHWSEDVTYEVIEREVCNQSQHFNRTLTSRHFCAKRGHKALKEHRGGKGGGGVECVHNYSPLMCLSSRSQWYCAGFVSFQYGCNGSTSSYSGYRYLSHPSVFSNVFAVKDFIERAIGLNAQSLNDISSFDHFLDTTTTTTTTTTTPIPSTAVETTSLPSLLNERTALSEETTNEAMTEKPVITTFESFNDSLPTLLANNSTIIS